MSARTAANGSLVAAGGVTAATGVGAGSGGISMKAGERRRVAVTGGEAGPGGGVETGPWSPLDSAND